MTERKPFNPIIYKEWAELIDVLSVEQRGELLSAFVHYPDYEPKDVQFWKFFKSQIEKQKDHYQAKCERLRNNRKQLKSIENNSNQMNSIENKCPLKQEQEHEQEQEPKKKYIKKKTELLKPETVPEDLWEEFVKYRKGIKKPLTQRALNRISSEAAKACISVSQAFEIIMDNEWRGFEADWIKNKPKDDQLARYAVPKEEVERYRAELRNKEPEIRLEPDDPPEFFNDQFIQEGFRRV